MLKHLACGILKMLGWKITGRYPYEQKKFIVLVAPHTSNWDFPLGILAKWCLRADIKYVAKHTLFKPVIGRLFRALGGYPVDRTRRTRFAEAVVDLFNSKDEFVITITPEGTRKRVPRFKTGIYYIARNAHIPILPTKFDYENKEINFGELFWTTDDKERDLNYLWDYFVGVKGKNPENGIFPRSDP